YVHEKELERIHDPHPLDFRYLEDYIEDVEENGQIEVLTEDRETAIGGKIYTFEEGLGRFDLTPGDIDMVIHTHLHNDHCENDYKCENARFYVHEKELERIHDPHPLDFRYLEDYIEDVEENGQIEVLTEDRE
ncbi:hypothetical protein ACRXB1_37410, partial [Caballeronia sp. M23-90]